MFTKTANRRIQFFFSWFLRDKNRLHSNFLSSKERFIFFNSHLVNGPDFRAHYLNICKLLLRPHRLRWHYERVSLTSSNWRKPFFTQFEYMRNRNIDQDLVNSLFITNSLTRFLRDRQLCYLLANRTATQRQHQDCRIPSFNKLKIQSKYYTSVPELRLRLRTFTNELDEKIYIRKPDKCPSPNCTFKIVLFHCRL